MDIQPPASIAISPGDHERMTSEVSEGRALLPGQLVTTRHDQHSIRREQRLEPQTVRQRLPRPNREVQLASGVLKTAALWLGNRIPELARSVQPE